MKKLFYFSNLLTLCLILSSASVKAQAPVITSDPTNDTACSGSVAMFMIQATNTPFFSWQESVDGITWTAVTNGGIYSGATTDTLSVSASAAVNGYMYRAFAFNGTGVDSSSAAMLVVNALPVAGVTSGPTHVCIGSTITLSNSVAGGTWSSVHPTIATVSTGGGVTGIARGADSILYTVSSPTCGSAVAAYVVTVDSTVVPEPITGPSTLCVASFITLANANTGGTWASTNGNTTVSSTGMVSGVTAGVDTIIYTFTNGCGTDVQTKIVTVESPLSAGTITGPGTLCAGTMSPFTATTPGGVWFSGDASVATVDLAGHVTGRGQGTAVISYLFGNSCGSFIAVDTINVERAVSVITGDDSISVGATTIFIDSVIGGMWMSNDTTIARVNSTTGVITGIALGNTTIVYTATNICGTTSMSKIIYVGTPPAAGTITGVDTFCVGTSITLTASVANGVWSSSNASATVDASGVVTGVIGGMRDTIRYTVTDGFGSTVATKVIYVNQAPVITIIGPATVALSTGYTLVATPVGGTWVTTDNAAVTFVSPNTFVALKRGITHLIYTVSNECGTSMDTFTVNLPVDTSASVVSANVNTTAMSIFPNPNNGSFSINIATNDNETAHVVITNMVGAVVDEQNIVANKATNITLAQPAGIYFVSATTSNGKYTARIVIAK